MATGIRRVCMFQNGPCQFCYLYGGDIPCLRCRDENREPCYDLSFDEFIELYQPVERIRTLWCNYESFALLTALGRSDLGHA
jgi:hypothetical protein